MIRPYSRLRRLIYHCVGDRTEFFESRRWPVAALLSIAPPPTFQGFGLLPAAETARFYTPLRLDCSISRECSSFGSSAEDECGREEYEFTRAEEVFPTNPAFRKLLVNGRSRPTSAENTK